MVRMLSAVTARVWPIHLSTSMSSSIPSKGVRNPQPHRGRGGQRSREAAEKRAEDYADGQIAASEDEDRQKGAVQTASTHERPRNRERQPSREQRHRQRLGEYQREHEAVRESERLEDR